MVRSKKGGRRREKEGAGSPAVRGAAKRHKQIADSKLKTQNPKLETLNFKL
jgi:hypothetical protein